MNQHKPYIIPWDLETDYCHHGMPLSNGTLGALVWFQDNRVMLTINRADYWDHRGGTEWTEEITYERLKKHLLAGDFESAKAMFQPASMNGKEKRPTRLPMGRYELALKPGMMFQSAALHLDQAEANIVCKDAEGTQYRIRIHVLCDHPVIAVDAGGVIGKTEIKPSFDFPAVLEYYQQFDIAPGHRIGTDLAPGWIQELPEDPANAVLSAWRDDSLLIASVYGEQAAEAVNHAHAELDHLAGAGYEAWTAPSKRHWNELWAEGAAIELPDRELMNIYYMGLYRMLGSSAPGHIAPSAQGPWVEEYRMPPWSGDHHFNINVQECLWPAYASNLTGCLEPLFRMIDRWKPRLALNARYFLGITDGYMLNHSTDDRAKPTGGMWTGTIDHANTSWVAQLMWQYYAYTLDEAFLAEEAYPFMKRAMNVYLAMLEEEDGRYVLPITVSPEYGGSGPQALGRNSSFFLANVHFLCEKLLQAGEQLEPDAAFLTKLRDVQSRLPLYTAGEWQPMEWPRRNSVSEEEIYLWEGQPLEVGHRHHSHLAGIYPFDVIDMDDPVHRAIVDNSIKTWVDKGTGRWAGWSMPWASILHNRVGNADAAYLMLKLYEDVFMMKGYTSRHNGRFKGFTQFDGGDTMQVEASIAASAAVLEMLVQCSRGKVKLFAGIPKRMKNVSFGGIRAEGAFLISGQKKDGKVTWVKLFSEKGAVLTLANPFQGKASIRRGSQEVTVDGEWLHITTCAGEEIRLTPAPAEGGSL